MQKPAYSCIVIILFKMLSMRNAFFSVQDDIENITDKQYKYLFLQNEYHFL